MMPQVSVLCHLFNETRPDRQSKEVLGEITDYNRRYSGAPRRVTDYLCDAPLLLQLLARSLATVGGLVWLFFFRVAVCCARTVVSLSSPPLDPASSSATPPETEPSLCGLLGVLDDLAAVTLLLICVINIYQQMAPESRGRSRAAMRSSL
ncbi:E3 ubiquitin-protein ligase RNF170 [Liparis tanakae]|uniref:E3 ubiquitin-protein ligase RNF170 n=1 Tax=Liparis tanakae TaxID=230148 RepID=A0A4Z2E3T6_9TELE|nr:E3 ubiquitin-protein ligase RNF170 [Liparis tanakae]